MQRGPIRTLTAATDDSIPLNSGVLRGDEFTAQIYCVIKGVVCWPVSREEGAC
jgi:hypothetical protein